MGENRVEEVQYKDKSINSSRKLYVVIGILAVVLFLIFVLYFVFNNKEENLNNEDDPGESILDESLETLPTTEDGLGDENDPGESLIDSEL